MCSIEIQTIIEKLAETLGKPITLEDRSGRLLGYSAHREPIDLARMETLLNRGSSAHTLKALKNLGVYARIEGAQGIVEVPAIPEIGMGPRLAVAIRSREEILAYIWIASNGASLLPNAEAAVIRASRFLSERILYHRPPTREQEDSTLVYTVLSGSAGEKALGRYEADHPEFRLEPPFQAAVICEGSGYSSAGELETLWDVVSGFATRQQVSVLVGAVEGRVAMVFAGLPLDKAKAFCEYCRVGLTERGFDIRVGLGSAYDSFSETGRSYVQAMAAIDLANRMGWAQVCHEYLDLALEDLMGCLSRCKSTNAFGRDMVESLCMFDRLHETDLVHTLRTFLNCQGRRRETADLLNIHPNTLDYRMRRIHSVVKQDISDYRVRLALHIWAEIASSRKVAPTTGPSRRAVSQLAHIEGNLAVKSGLAPKAKAEARPG